MADETVAASETSIHDRLDRVSSAASSSLLRGRLLAEMLCSHLEQLRGCEIDRNEVIEVLEMIVTLCRDGQQAVREA